MDYTCSMPALSIYNVKMIRFYTIYLFYLVNLTYLVVSTDG